METHLQQCTVLLEAQQKQVGKVLPQCEKTRTPVVEMAASAGTQLCMLQTAD